MEDIKETFVTGNYFEVGTTALLLLILFGAIIYLLFILFKMLIKVDYKHRFSKKGINEFFWDVKYIISEWIPPLIFSIMILSTLFTLVFVVGFVVKLFI